MTELTHTARLDAETSNVNNGLDGTATSVFASGSETPHAYLRRVTRPWHDGVERAFESFDLQTQAGLSGFLLRQAEALFPLEAALEAAGVANLLADWPARRRAGLLAADLGVFGLRPPASGAVPHLRGPFQMLGALYVLEGSKLGARVLHRRVLASPDARVRAADTFLAHRQERGWTSFLAVLEAADPGMLSRDALCAGAELAFKIFETAAREPGWSQLPDSPTRFGLYRQAHA